MEGEENKFAKITNDIIVKSIAAASGVADNNIQLVGHEESEGSVHGVENFTGKLTAIAATAKVDGAVREFFFMAKCVQMEEFHALDNEVAFYVDIRPKLREYDPELCIPVCHYASNGVLVMENLKKVGYEPPSKDLSQDQILIGLELLARFHAATYRYFQQSFQGDVSNLESAYPGTTRSTWLRHDLTDYVQGWLIRFHAMVVKVLRKHSENKQILEKLEAMGSDGFTERAFKDMAAKEGSFNTIVHNDAGKGNLMFRSTESAQLVDFEDIRHASPAWDLLKFLTSALAPFERNVDPLLKHYHTTLVDRLTAFGYGRDICPIEDLMSDYSSQSTFAFFLNVKRCLPGVDEILDCEVEADLVGIEEKVLTPATRASIVRLTKEAEAAKAFEMQ